MSYMDLGSFYRIMFQMHRHHKYDMEYMEELIPWELHMYTDMVLEAVKEEKDLQQSG